jgi:regulator of extracellular matrix RemA (YlzA/DUF370 family)
MPRHERRKVSRFDKAAVFVIQRERSDGSMISIFSKCSKTFLRMTEDGTIDAKSDGSSLWKKFRIVVVMDAKHVTGSLERACAPDWETTSTLQQCYSSFVSWRKGLDSFAARLDGNLMAAVRVVTASGDVVAPVTEVIHHSGDKNSVVQLGKVVPATWIGHGNVVAFQRAVPFLKQISIECAVSQRDPLTSCSSLTIGLTFW